MNVRFVYIIFIIAFETTLASTTEASNFVNHGFIKNQGQLNDESVLFYLPLKDQNIVIRKNGFSYDNFKSTGIVSYHHRVDFIFQNSEDNVEIGAFEPSEYYQNFYLNAIEVLAARTYQSVIVYNIYPGIDIHFGIDGNGNFKYDFVIANWAELSLLKFKIEGATAKLDNESIKIKTNFGVLREIIPYSYLEKSGKSVKVFYKDYGDAIFGLGSDALEYDETLIIDPTPILSWATYHGGSSFDQYLKTSIDKNGNIYSVGWTSSTSNISTSGAFQTSIAGSTDVMLSKFDISGKLIWSTYYGGSGADEGRAITLDNAGGLYIAGGTYSTSGISTSGSHQASSGGSLDGFIAKFSESGSRIWGTYYGGSSLEEFYGACVDSSGGLYIVGKTSSSSSIATTGAHSTSYAGGEDAVLIKLTQTGTRVWATYFGGSLQDIGTEVCIGKNNDIYFTGLTYSSSAVASSGSHQSSLGGSYDAFLARFNSTGTRIWSTYIGASGDEVGSSIIFNRVDQIMISGMTTSTSAIATSAAYKSTNSGGEDGYIQTFDTAGKRIYGTYLGGTGNDRLDGLLNFQNRFWIVGGRTTSGSGIATADGMQTTYGGNSDCFLMIFDTSFVLKNGTYYGGSQTDYLIDFVVHGPSVIITGSTQSTNAISTTSAHQTTYGGGTDGFLAKLDYSCGFNNYVSKVVSEPKCYRDSNGIAFVKVVDGKSTYSYYWKTTPPQFKDTANNLPKGIYEVVITDSSGCKDSIKVIVNEPERLKAFVKDSVDISCYGKKDGMLVAGFTGGTTPPNFEWNTIPKQHYDTLWDVGKGWYQLKITDVNGCKDSAWAEVNEPDSLTSAISGFKNPSCYGLNDGYIDATVNGGTKPYSYTWSDSVAQNTPSAYKLSAGYYEVDIKDKNGCRSKVGYTLTQPSPINIGIVNREDPRCFNDSSGQIYTKISGGTPGYKLEWNTNPVSNAPNLLKLPGGIYRLTVMDSLNCVETKTIVLREPAPLILRFDSMISVKCKGESNGSVYLQVAGGKPQYDIFWHHAPLSTDQRISGLKAGVYKVTVSDSFGCKEIDSIRINEPDSVLVKGQIRHVNCFGNTTGEVTAFFSGGLSPYSWMWQHDSTISTPYLFKVKAGNYTIKVSDKNNCSNVLQFIVREPSAVDIKAEFIKNLSCFEGSDGRISVSVSGGTTPLTLIWNTNPVSNNLTIGALKAGTYKAQLTDSFGCADSISILLTEPKGLSGFFDSIFSPSCYMKPDGRSIYRASGGTKPYSYSFDNAPFQFDSLVYNVGAGKIFLKLLDANGCLLKDSSVLLQPQILKAAATIIDVRCFGLADGKIIVNADGGVKPYSYFWYNAVGSDSAMAGGLTKGFYFLRITDRNNCVLNDTFTITQPEKLILKIDLSLPATCFNGKDGIGSASATGGTVPYNFFWNGVVNASGPTATNLRPGNYKVFVTDKNACLDSALTSIGRPERVTARIATSSNPICVGDSNGSATGQGSLGVPPYSYLWSNGSRNATAKGLKKGSYIVVVSDACGDTSVVSVTINDPEPFVIHDIVGFPVAKMNSIESFSIKDSAGWQYFWQVENGTIVSGQSTPAINIKWGSADKGRITVIVTNQLGCVDEASFKVTLFEECMFVFPNPALLETTVFLPFLVEGDLLELIDTKGAILMTFHPEKVNTINVKGLASDIYIFRAGKCYVKFMKQR
jgi:hypothetical protein